MPAQVVPAHDEASNGLPQVQESLLEQAEEWCKVTELPYEVSTYGNVRRIGASHNLRPGSHTKGYAMVCLSKPRSKPRTFFVHRLLLETFVGPCPEGWMADHKDGNKKNNHLSNLEWVTARENTVRALVLGLLTTRLTPETVREIKNSPLSLRKIARQYGVSRDAIHKVKRGRAWKHVVG